jgi:hypothetical protein
MSLRKIGIISCLVFCSLQQTFGMEMYYGIAKRIATAKDRLSKVPTSLLGIGGAFTFVGTTVLTGGMSLPLFGLGAYCAYYRSYCKMDALFAKCDSLGIQIDGVETRLGEKITSVADIVRAESNLTRSEISVCQVGISAIGEAVRILKERDLPELREGLVADNEKTRILCNQRFNSLEVQFTGAVQEITSCVSSLTMLSSDDGHLHMILDKMGEVHASLEKQSGEFTKMKATVVKIEEKMDANHADIVERQQMSEAKMLSERQKDKEDSERLFNQVLDQGERTDKKLSETRKELNELRSEVSLMYEMIATNQSAINKRFIELDKQAEKQAQKTEQNFGTIHKDMATIKDEVVAGTHKIMDGLDALSASGGTMVPAKNNKKRTKNLSYRVSQNDEDTRDMEKVIFTLPLSDLVTQRDKMGDAIPIPQMTIAAYMDPLRKIFRLEGITVQSQNPDQYNVSLPRHYLFFDQQDRQRIESLSRSGDAKKAVRTQSGPASVGRNVPDHCVDDTLQMQIQSPHLRTSSVRNIFMHTSNRRMFGKSKFSEATGLGVNPSSVQGRLDRAIPMRMGETTPPLILNG